LTLPSRTKRVPKERHLATFAKGERSGLLADPFPSRAKDARSASKANADVKTRNPNIVVSIDFSEFFIYIMSWKIDILVKKNIV
jgi:hypothetical protein